MKISLNWIKQFTTIEVSVDELVTKIGSQLGEVEEVIKIGDQYKDVTIAKVVACDKHPNADKLSVCLLDDNGAVENVERKDGLVEVVCGAPNVAAGMLVAWLPPGSIVPETYFSNEQFVLESRELRGVVSNGMIASARELSLGDEHDGILTIDEDAQSGDSFAKLYDLEDEVIIDIENKMFTHRPDCFGILGVAREIAGIQQIEFTSPDWYAEQVNSAGLKVNGDGLSLGVDNQLPELVPRFMAVVMDGVTVKSSPVKVRSYLARVGLKPINNIVDTTNIIMHLTGQPLHAFDYDKVAQLCDGDPTIEVRHPREDETIALLNGKTITPRAEAIMIATPQHLIGVGGIMGGRETEVDANTTCIIIECANFDMYSVRRTSMEHGLFTDAVTRFNKGQSPHQNDKVLAIAIQDVIDFAGGNVASEITDITHDLPTNQPVEVTVDFINQRLGSELTAATMVNLLTNVEFEVAQHENRLTVMAPYWRTDIAIPEDIVEEVGRLHGYNNLPKNLPLRTIKPARRSDLLAFKQRLRSLLASAGANEALTYSFLHEQLLSSAAQNPQEAFTLSNALSPDLQKYRLSLTPSLLSHVHTNIKAGHLEFALFEIGKTHTTRHLNEEQVPAESESTALVYSRKHAGETGAAFYQARTILDYVTRSLNLEFMYEPFTEDPGFNMTAPFDMSRSAAISIKGREGWVGVIGEYKQSVANKLKLPDWTAGFELSTEDLMAAADNGSVYTPLSIYPSVNFDITLQIDANTSFAELNRSLQASVEAAQIEADYQITLLPVQEFHPPNTQSKNITFRLIITPLNNTLNSEAANTIKSKILEGIKISIKEV